MLQKAVQPYPKCPARALDCSLELSARLHAMSHTGVLAAPQASTSPNKICQADKKLISLLHSFSRHNSSPGCGRNAELGLELVSAQVRNEPAVGSVALALQPCLPGTPQLFASRSLLFGLESASCSQADPKVPLISSHLCCLIP